MTVPWSAFDDAVRTARAELQAAAPDDAAAREAEAYVVRLAAAALSEAFLNEHLTRGGLGQALPVRGGANPDYVMSGAGIDPSCAYHVRGSLRGSERVGIGLYALDAAGGLLLTGYHAFGPANVRADGCFAVELAPTPDTRVLVVRVLHRDPLAERAAVELDGVPPVQALTPATGSVEGGLAFATRTLLGGARQFLTWSQLLSERPNVMVEPPKAIASAVQGDPATRYAFAYYHLASGQSLELLVPRGLPGYWSLHAYNHWLEVILGAGTDDRKSVPEADGRTRVRVAPTAGGSANRIDTRGRDRGVLIFRAFDADAIPLPSAQLV